MFNLNISLPDKDAGRLFAIQEARGDDRTAAELAREILVGALWELFPATPRRDEDGNLTNADKYQGDRAAGKS